MFCKKFVQNNRFLVIYDRLMGGYQWFDKSG
ncbi:hypothetical protein HD_1997 [[Haemophilus] ducreyi 35000HP]|uniref:Uncharacterized protein n=1 Tax=Haemophilus ducreyi (strain 35000HP / ATCC 700724) TaxID=233412 RepID=Q7VKB9_HAEDU|nr:hypothetical protein HD_1997 [[Haemophilus] ducreyi 35000HP]